MRHSRGFTLVELMTAMAVYGIFLAMLSGAFYALLTFGSRSQKVLVARERGRRVIEYVDSRIRNAGLGLHALKTGKEVRDAIKPLTWDYDGEKGPLTKYNQLRLPVALKWKDKNSFNDNDFSTEMKIASNDKIYYGNILTLLYAERETKKWETVGGKDYAVSLIITPYNASGDIVESLDVEVNSKDPVPVKFLAYNTPQYEKTFGEEKFNGKRNIGNWAVLRGAGIPVRVKGKKGEDEITLQTFFDSSLTARIPSFKIYAGDELLYLRCERIFAEDPASTDDDTARNLKVQKLDGSKFGNAEPTETGILEIYGELDTRTNIFTLWVLSTGGKDSIIHERPSDWPDTARPTDWDNKNNFYKYETLYVSKASWKIHNVCEGFDWGAQ